MGEIAAAVGCAAQAPDGGHRWPPSGGTARLTVYLLVWRSTPTVAWRDGCTMTETVEPIVKLDKVEWQQFAQQLVDQTKFDGVDLIAPAAC